jgi:alkaline phosphatase
LLADELNPEYWNQQAFDSIKLAEQRMPNVNQAKNVILFLGDGMGVSTLTAGRIRKGQLEGKSGEEGTLNFERFDNLALIKVHFCRRLYRK